MNHAFPEQEELRTLLESLCDETIRAEQMERLEAIVLARPQAEAYFVQWMNLHADLIGHFDVGPARLEQILQDRIRSGQVASEPAPTPAPTPADAHSAPASVAGKVGTSNSGKRRSVRRSFLFAALTTAAAALLAFVALSPSGSKVEPKKAPTPEALDNTVAVLIQAPGAKWEDDGSPAPVGGPLAPGPLRLKSGLVHIEFYCGATVILEGPAEFELISRTEAFCRRGKLRTLVPPTAHGFTIGSPTVDLVDRGTEFGLEVGADKTEVHVFQGKVELFDAGKPRQQAAARELVTGQGVRLDGPDQARDIKTNPAGFVTVEGLAKRSREELVLRQKMWRTHSAALRKDPSLRVYYTFESKEAAQRNLVDMAGEPDEARDGVVIGCTWGNGRWPGKTGLEFKRVSDRVRFKVPGEFESITLAAWVRIDALPNQNNSLMMADGWNEGELHWQIGADGTIILGVQARRGTKGAHYHAREAIGPEFLGQWIHMAVTYDQENAAVTHYVNGRAYAQHETLFDIPLRIGDAELGNWNIATHRNNHPVRFWTGGIDEFLMFDRALSQQEVDGLWQDGKPSL